MVQKNFGINLWSKIKLKHAPVVPLKTDQVMTNAKYFEVQIALYFFGLMDNFAYVQNFHDIKISRHLLPVENDVQFKCRSACT